MAARAVRTVTTSTIDIVDRVNAVRLGMTDLDVFPIAFGAWQLGGEWGAVDEEGAASAIRHARELGVNFFDTAQAYGFGVSERLLGRALRDDLDNRRYEVAIATKGGLRMTQDGLVRDSSPAWLRWGVDASLQALGVDYIDLYQVHWPDSKVPFVETAGALQELVDEGKIRHVGVSNFDADQMAAFAQARPVETLQRPYDPFRRDIEGEVLPYCADRDVGVLVYGPLAPERNLAAVQELQRLANDEFGVSVSRLAIAWTLANPAVHVAIVGARHPDHTADSVAAAEMNLSESDLEQIDRVMSAAAPMGGPHPEMMPE
jgi:aryl-alcohol dehydrogenase-like predicted oxidoreductase